MAACALSSGRVTDNAVFKSSQDIEELSRVPSRVFYQAAIDALPKSDLPTGDFNVMRTYALLSLIAIQYGDHRDMQGYLGKYHAMVAMDGLHDEKNWPQGLGIIELEERRRLVSRSSAPTGSLLTSTVLVDLHIRCVQLHSLQICHPCKRAAVHSPLHK